MVPSGDQVGKEPLSLGFAPSLRIEPLSEATYKPTDSSSSTPSKNPSSEGSGAAYYRYRRLKVPPQEKVVVHGN